jgi:branched-chain amino acid transport system permease protein
VPRTEGLLQSRRWLACWLAGSLVLAVLGLVFDGYSLSTVREALILGLFAMSLDFLWSRVGILSFGHAAFFGIGGYGMAILGVQYHWSAVQALPVALGATVLVAALFGYFLFYGKVRGTYFTLMTMALTLVCQQLAISWVSVTGGDSGLINVPGLVFGPDWMDFSAETPAYFLVLAVVIVVAWVLRQLSIGRYGLILQALQDHEVRASALGHNADLYLLSAFVGSAFVAGLAGALYVSTAGIVAPDLIGPLFSTEVIVWVAVGGMGSLLGPILGAFLVHYVQQHVSSWNPSAWPLFLGCGFLVLVFVLPNGLFSIWQRLRTLGSALSGRPTAAPGVNHD